MADLLPSISRAIPPPNSTYCHGPIPTEKILLSSKKKAGKQKKGPYINIYTEEYAFASEREFMPFIPFGKNANGILSTRSTGRLMAVYAVYAMYPTSLLLLSSYIAG